MAALCGVFCGMPVCADDDYGGTFSGSAIEEGQPYEGQTDSANFAGGFRAGVHAGNAQIHCVNNIFRDNTTNYGAIYGILVGGGGAIYSSSRQITIDDSIFENNRSTSLATPTGGGAIMISTNQTAGGYIKGSTFTGNSAANDGGAIYFNNVANFTISDDTAFIGNSAGNYGGALYVGGDTYSILNSVNDVMFSGNNAENGGAIYFKNGMASFDNVTFEDNTASLTDGFGGYGGAIYVDKFAPRGSNIPEYTGITIDNSKFSGNEALDGGAIYTKNDSALDTVSNTTFEGNSAELRGGAIYIDDASLKVQNSTFKNNNSGTRGGAIAFYAIKTEGDENSVKSLIIENSDFIGNTSEQNSGGAIYINASSDEGVPGAKEIKIISNDGKAHEFTGNQHGTGEDFRTEYNAMVIDNGKVQLVTEGEGSKLIFNDGISGSNPSLHFDGGRTSHSAIDVNGDVEFNAQVKNVTLALNGGTLSLNAGENTNFDGTSPILNNVDLILESGKLDLQNGNLDILNIRHFNATNSEGSIILAIDANLAEGKSDLFDVEGEMYGSLNFDAEHFDINILKEGNKSFNLFSKGADTLTFVGDSVIQYTERNKYEFTLGEDGLINVKRHSSGGINDAIAADGIREFKVTPAANVKLTESLGDMGGEYLKINMQEKTLDGNGNSGINVSEGQRLEIVNAGSADGSNAVQGFVSENSGAVVNNSGTVKISNSYFKNNTSSTDGGVINNNVGGKVEITDSSFVNNRAEGSGGAINNIGGSITITAKEGDVLFAGNTAAKVINDIYMVNSDDKVASLTFNGSKNTTLNGGISGEGVITKEDSGVLYLNGDNSKYTGDVNYNGGVVSLGADAQYFSAQNTHFANNAMLSLINNQANSVSLGNVVLDGNGKLGLDVNLMTGESDKIAADSVSGEGKLIIDDVNIITDSNVQIESMGFDVISLDKDGYSPLFGRVDVSPNAARQAMGPIMKYGVTFNPENGRMTLSSLAGGSYHNYNPSVFAAPVGALVGAYLTQLHSYDMAFNNSDMYMLMPSKARNVLRMQNKVAISDGTVPYQAASDWGYWLKPYTTIESVKLSSGPKVSNLAYGSYFGADSGIKDIGKGFDGMLSFYAGYNGSHQSYSGNSIYQNGAQLGLTGTAFKDKFFATATVNVGASVGEANTMFGRDNFTMLSSGLAAKTGYNFEMADGKFIIQPNYMMSYSFINTFDYTNAAGVHINSDPLHVLQLSPGVKFIGNLPKGWQPYAGVNVVWNLLGDTSFTANNIALPEFSIDPYFSYGAGVQKLYGDRVNGYFQTMVRSGGRNGVGLQFGMKCVL